MAKISSQFPSSDTDLIVRKTVARKGASKKKPDTVSADETHYKMIQDAAYFIAERNNFAGDTQAYWLEAESQINGIFPH